jgi:hypothetical protein
VISNFGSNDILWIGQGQYGYEYQFLNDFANELDLDDFRFANNVVWSQIDDAGSVDQEVMTLDTEQFTGGSLAAIYNEINPIGIDGEAIASIDEASDWVDGTVITTDTEISSIAFIPDSLPISGTEPTPEPYFPDTNPPA